MARDIGSQHSKLKPKYPHNRPHCIFLGAHIFEGRWHDLYYCQSPPTLMARFGSNAEDYMSRNLQMQPRAEPMAVARRMAEERGLIHGSD
jgi:hypothetical protein